MVTVNLTALLVLTTLFISVSGKLPPTAYVKMVDIWLIFSQMVPFVEVLLHTFMDCMREEEDREINHHGHRDLTQRSQNEPVEARKILDQNPGEKNGEKNGEQNGEKNGEKNGDETGEENEQIKRIFVISVNSEEDKQVVNILGLYLLT